MVHLMHVTSPKFKHFICTIIIVFKLRSNSNSQIFLEFKSNSKLRTVSDFLLKIRCDLAQVVNMKVPPNDPIYLLVKVNIFWRLLSTFLAFISFLCYQKGLNKIC
jgi:hypothetical protein